MSIEHIGALAIAFFIGVLLGVMGSGGSIVTLPVLVYMAGIRPQSAVPMSMVIVGSASLIAAFLHARRGNFHFKAALLLGSTGIVGAYVGSGATHLLSPNTIMLIFAAILLMVGLAMLSGRMDSARPSATCRAARCLAVGAGVGLLTGFLGVGGGFLIVPALILFAGLEAKEAVGTSLAIIALNSAGGIVGQIRYVDLEWPLTLAFTGLTLAGMLAGLPVGDRLSEETLQKAFAFLLLGVGVVIGGLTLFKL